MAKLVAGFFLGVLVSAVGYWWLETRVANEAAPSSNRTMSPQPASVSDDAPPDGPARVRGRGYREQLSSRATDDQYAEDSDTLPTPPTPPSSVTNGVPATAAIGVPATRRASVAANNYPPEIADMLENRVNKELHAQYEADAREESWATYMEGQLRGYFQQNPALRAFNFSTVDCRTSICEVHALGYGPDALTEWNLATADLVTQPWHDFNQMSMDRHNPQPDVLGIVLILVRPQQQP